MLALVCYGIVVLWLYHFIFIGLYCFQFCHTYSEIDAWELESLGFQRCKTATKLRVLKVCNKHFLM